MRCGTPSPQSPEFCCGLPLGHTTACGFWVMEAPIPDVDVDIVDAPRELALAV